MSRIQLIICFCQFCLIYHLFERSPPYEISKGHYIVSNVRIQSSAFPNNLLKKTTTLVTGFDKLASFVTGHDSTERAFNCLSAFHFS